MRDRLIERIKMSVIPSVGEWAEVIADDILADGWMRPPVKVGDDVYTIKDGQIKKQFVVEVSKHRNGKMYFHYVPYDKLGVIEHFYLPSMCKDSDIGKTVFTDREDAVKALRGGEDK